jgi:signal peptidase I
MPLISEQRRNISALIAASASAAVPGLGQFLSGAYGWGSIFLAAFMAVLLTASIGRLWTSPPYLMVVIWALLLIYLIAAVRAAAQFRPRLLTWLGIVPVILLVGYFSSELALKISLRPTGFRLFTITTGSMEPTLRLGDHVVTDMHWYRSHAFSDRDPVLIFDGRMFLVKRIAALPGQTISGHDGIVYINGISQREPYAWENGVPGDEPLRNFGPVTVPSEKCFLMGDNRENSFDSRMPEFGLKPLSEIVGRPLYILGRSSGPWYRPIN